MPETTSARAIVRISALPDSGLRRALQGTVDDARRASGRVQSIRERDKEAAREAAQAEDRESKRVRREVEKDIDRVAKAKQKAARDAVKAAEKAARDEARAAEQSAKAKIKAAEKAAREQERAAERASSRRRAFAAGAVGAAFGFAEGAANLVGRGQQVAGVDSLESRLTNAANFRQQLIQASNEAGVSAEDRAKIEERLLKASTDTNVSILDLVGGLTEAQRRFDQFREFGDNIGDIARVAAAAGEPVADLVGALGTATKVFQLDKAGQQEFLDVLVSTAARGSVGVGNISRDLAPTMSSFQIATHRGGVEGMREFLALSQVMGTSQLSSPEIATRIERLMASLQDVDIQKKLLRRGGIQVTKGGKIGGELQNIGDIAAAFASSGKFQKAQFRQDVFTEIRAREGAQFLAAELQRNPEAFRSLQNIGAGEGNKLTQTGLAALQNDPLFRLQNLGARAQASTVRNADEIVKKIEPAVTRMTELQMQFPILTESMGTLNSTVRSLIGALVANKLITGGAGFASGPGAAALGVAGALPLGQAFGAAGTLGKLGIIGQVAAVGAASYFSTSELMKLTGLDKGSEGVGNWFADLFGQGAVEKRSRRGLTAADVGLDRSKEGEQKPMDLSDKALAQLKQNGRARVDIRILQDGTAVVDGVSTNEDIDTTVRAGNSVLR